MPSSKERIKRPLLNKIRKGFFLIGSIGLLLTLVVVAKIEVSSIKSRIALEMKTASQTLSGIIKKHIFHRDRDIKEMLASIDPKLSKQAVIAILETMLPKSLPGDCYYALDSNGTLVYISNPSYRPYLGLRLSVKGYFKEGRISPIHQSFFSNRTVISVLYPMKNRWSLLVDKDLGDLVPIASEVRIPGLQGFATLFILMRSGTIVYHPDWALMRSRANLLLDMYNIEGPDAYGLIHYKYEGIHYLAFRSAMKVPKGWIFYAAIPEAQVNRQVALKVFPILAFISLLFLVFWLILHNFVKEQVVKPIQMIAHQVTSISPESLGDRLPDELAHGIGELAMIVDAINRFLQSIVEYQARLSQSEELFRTVTEFTADWSFWLGPDGSFKYVSPVCEEITGYTAGEFMARPELMTDIVHPDDRWIYEDHMDSSLMKKEEPHEPMEYRIIRKDGQVRWIRHICRGVFGQDGSFLGSRGNNIDITDLKKAMLAVERERNLLAVTLSSIGDGVIATNKKGQVILINRAAEKLTGWTSEEAVGRPVGQVFSIINEDTGEHVKNPVEKVLETGKVVGLANNTILISRDGTKRAIADSGAPIVDKDGVLHGVVLVFRDVTEERMVEAEKQKLEKLESLGVLAGGIAHDFNNLLTAILGNIALSKMRLDSSSPIYPFLTRAEHAATAAQSLTQQLLTFSKGGAPIRKVTSLGEIIEETARFSIRGSNVSAKFEISPDLWAANVDPNQISQVIQNLVINADQAMPDGGMITIKAENVMVKRPGPLGLKPGPYVAISVIDQGHGIEKNILPKIFDPYFSTKEGGSGLGLATTHSIVKRHDGAIEIESTPGHGSRFTVYLPAVPGAPTTRSERVELSAEKKEVKGGRILVMDDEEAIRSLTIDVLKMLGYEAVSVSNGEEAIRLYKRAMEEGRPFDAVIMDLTIAGGMGGEEAAKKIREIDPETKIIVSSGYSSSAVMSQYRLHGFDAALPKPYNINQLREVLLEVLEEGDRSGKSAKTV